MTALNPYLRIGDQITEVLRACIAASARSAAARRAIEMLRGGADPASRDGARASIRTSSPAACASA